MSNHQDSRTAHVDQLIDENAVTPDNFLTHRAWREAVDECLQGLDPVRADILRSRFGLDAQQEETLREIGDRYGLSRERIRQLQEEALQPCRDRLRDGAASQQLPELHQTLR